MRLALALRTHGECASGDTDPCGVAIDSHPARLSVPIAKAFAHARVCHSPLSPRNNGRFFAESVRGTKSAHDGDHALDLVRLGGLAARPFSRRRLRGEDSPGR